MGALVSSFLFQGMLNRRPLAPPAPAGSVECPSLSVPHPATGHQTSGYSTWVPLPGPVPARPSPHPLGLVSTVTPSHKLPFPPLPVAPGLHILVCSLQPESPPHASASADAPRHGCQGLHFARMAAFCFSQERGATGTRMFSGSHRKRDSSL